MAPIERFRPYLAVELLLRKGDKVLMQRRFKTGWADGWYNQVSGHVDTREFAIQSMVREAKEEADIIIKPEDLNLVHIQQLIPKPGQKEFVYFYFECKKWKGEPKIMEPEKHDDLSWFPLDNLPEKTIPYIRTAIGCYKNNVLYSEVDISYPEKQRHLLA